MLEVLKIQNKNNFEFILNEKVNISFIMIYVIFATSCNDSVIEDIDKSMTEYQKENKPIGFCPCVGKGN